MTRVLERPEIVLTVQLIRRWSGWWNLRAQEVLYVLVAAAVIAERSLRVA